MTRDTGAGILSWMRLLFLAVIAFLPLTASAQALRPYAEYEPVKYLVMSAGFDYQTESVKRLILSRLPDGVLALIYPTSESEWTAFKRAGLESDHVERMDVRSAGQALWARDSFPYPMVEGGGISLVAAAYPQHFDPVDVIAARLGAAVRRHSTPFEHGNLAANARGDCVVVQENFAASASDEVFRGRYGCRRLLRLPFIAGIGHVDEVVKFLSDDEVLTDQPAFVKTLGAFGYRVILLPKAVLPEALARRGVFPQRSYVNSLLINKTVFVPTFGLPTDEEALEVYRSFRLEVVAVPAAYVADYGGGSLHCLTMTYPAQ